MTDSPPPDTASAPPEAQTAAAQPPPAPAQDTFMVTRMGMEEGPYTFAELQTQLLANQIKYNTMVRRGSSNLFPAAEIPGLFSEK